MARASGRESVSLFDEFRVRALGLSTSYDIIVHKYSSEIHVETEEGFINPTNGDANCPQAYYFAPQRESKPDVVLATNMFLRPSRRLCGMDPWTVDWRGLAFLQLAMALRYLE